MKTSTQLKALVRNLSLSSNVAAEIILRNFMLERLLERIAISKYRHNFILKGGLLIAAMVGIDTRTTMDMDATINGQALNETEIETIIEDILHIPIDDYVEFKLYKIEGIHEEADYPGYRVSIAAILDRTRQMLKIDITAGDFVTPREIEYSFKLMFEDRSINIMAYNLETVLAEKFETIITRSTANSRMRDFYDIYILTTTQTFDVDTFKEALTRTTEKRGTIQQMSEAGQVITMIAKSSVMVGLWNVYSKKYSYASDVRWDMAVRAVTALYNHIQ